MIAHALTTVRLLLAVPVGVAFAHPGVIDPRVVAGMIAVAVASDFADGSVARRMGTASSRGRLFDHSTDFLFVTAGLTGAALGGHVPVGLPLLVAVAFLQYVADSYWLHRQKQLRMSSLGRWNGILYFVPIVALGIAGLTDGDPLGATVVANVAGWALVVTTLASIADRAAAAPPDPAD